MLTQPSGKPKYCIALQPICNSDMDHIGDELLYRSAADAKVAIIEDDQTATARACQIACYEVGLANLVGSRKLFINMPNEWLLQPELLPPHPDQVVIEVLESVVGSPEIIAALHKIRAMGFSIALDDFILTEETKSLLNVANIIKVDLSVSASINHIGLYKSKGIKLLAERVEDYNTFVNMRKMGFELFQGYFYGKPETHKATARNRSSNNIVLVKLLSELQNNDISYKELQNIITLDPELTYYILKYTNSALFHHGGEIHTITQALNALGLRRVRIIAMTIMLANNGPASRLALNQALTRAAMCENLSTNIGSGYGVAFTAGLMSMMDVLLGEPLPDLLSHLPMSSETIEAILYRKHSLGELISRVEEFESASVHDWESDLVERYNDSWLKSQTWATQTLANLNTH